MNKLLSTLFTCSLLYGANAQVSPLLSTTWNQTCHYNALLPSVSSGGSCGNAFVGCNATALGQIVKYYGYPTTGMGSHCNSLSPTDCVDYELANYDYSAMPNSLSSPNLEVAQLMYDLGVAVDMNWNGTNSTSSFASSALKEHYIYSPKMRSTGTLFVPMTELIDDIKNELDSGRPVYAKGGSHFFLIDGYNTSDEFHMNFGWGGIYDGYYPLNNVVNGAGIFNPTNFVLHIEPLNGTIEAAKDTIFISSGGTSSESLEFTSTLNWTASSLQAWITINLTGGSKGYFNFSDGSSISVPTNNGPERSGYIVLDNGTDDDTVFVVQAASPMTVNPDYLTFNHLSGSQNVDITHDSWSSWDLTTSDSWITLSASTGTGLGNFDVMVSENTTGLDRSGYVAVSGSIYTDTIFVDQESVPSVGLNEFENEVTIGPNPVTTLLTVSNTDMTSNLMVLNTTGQNVELPILRTQDTLVFDFSLLPGGVYFLILNDQQFKIIHLE